MSAEKEVLLDVKDLKVTFGNGKKTFEAVEGAKNAVVHLYNSTSYAQRTQVFKKSKEEILKIATDGAKLLNDMAEKYNIMDCIECGICSYLCPGMQSPLHAIRIAKQQIIENRRKRNG